MASSVPKRSSRKRRQREDAEPEELPSNGSKGRTTGTAGANVSLAAAEGDAAPCEVPLPGLSALDPNDPKTGTDPNNPVRIYADGVFDMFHFGHARALEQAKKLFPHVFLLVGVCSEADTHKYKGKTVMNAYERAESVRHCRWVDEVIENCPWTLTQEFLVKHGIDFVAHDAEPYTMGAASQSDDVYGMVKRLGRFLPTNRTPGISTTDLLNRIVRDYDTFVLRNLQRGADRKEMNVSFIKAKEVTVRSKMRQVGDRIGEQLAKWRDNTERLGEKVDSLLEKWSMESGKLIAEFVARFNRNRARVSQFFSSPSASPATP